MIMKKVFITGGSGGLGITVVSKLLEQDYSLVLLFRSEASAASFENEFSSYSERFSTIIGEVSDESTYQKVSSLHTDLSGVVHLAGGFNAAKDFTDDTLQSYLSMQQLNAQSAFLVFKYLLPILLEKGAGSMITIGAKPAEQPSIENVAYASSKSSLVHLTRSAAQLAKRTGVRVNCILPGIIKTKANESWGKTEEMKHWTTPEEIANVIEFLLSDASSGVNDTLVKMYGGI